MSASDVCGYKAHAGKTLIKSKEKDKERDEEGEREMGGACFHINHAKTEMEREGHLRTYVYKCFTQEDAATGLSCT